MASAITVSQLNRRVKSLLEQGIGRLWVEGELSNIARPASGHVYFSLKDDRAQVRAAWFRQRQRGSAAKFRDGDQVLVFGRVSLYEPRGDYQLIVEQIEPAGEGALRQAFEALKKKLAAEGLFDEARKRTLPVLPRRIGIITSPTGAAIRDLLTVLRRRFPAVPVVIYPSAVQGDAAVPELLSALKTAVRRAECDVLIIGRGGGSLEDLWAFNDEQLARAIADSRIPVVSAVGHEVDFTIADFVADLRAPTPSGAAELVVPDAADWRRALAKLATRIARLGQRTLEERAQMLDWLTKRLRAHSPVRTLTRQSDRLREVRGLLVAVMRQSLSERHYDLQQLGSALLRASPALSIQRGLSRLSTAEQRLAVAAKGRVNALTHRVQLAAGTLDAVSPLATLARGYAIVEDLTTGNVLRSAEETRPGNDIRARLAVGSLTARVTSVSDDD